MALSETARLIASLELQDKFSKPANNANQALGRLQRGFGQTGKGLGQVSAGLGTAAVRVAAFGTAVAAAGIGFLAVQVRAGIDSLRELQNVQTQTGAVLVSTKGVAGQTAESVRALSERFEDLNATMDDKVIQSAANVLLTFTNVRKEAFEPAIEAALNMNQALGGGPEGLQGTVIQLGKALQDPIKGITALRRVGVNFSEEQKKQIKLLVEQNDLYGAQQIILAELATEFGGSFARAGDTATARSAKLRDKIEELQQTLAKPIVPVIDKITTKLIDLFDKPATAAAVSNLGNTIAGLFTDENLGTATRALDTFLAKLTPANFAKIGEGVRSVFGFLKEVPWGTIGEGLKITGQAAKVAVDAFLSLPKEVQGIVIAALAVNKLSGGLVGTGIGTIGKGLGNILLGGGLLGRGASPANPVWVQSVGGVGGPGGGGPAGGAKIPFTPVPILTAGAIAALPIVLTGSEAGSEVAIDMLRQQLLQGKTVKEAIDKTGITLGAINTLLAHPELQEGLSPEILTALDAIDGKMGDLVTNTAPRPKLGGLVPKVTPTLPNTATDAGGGVVNLPNTALAPLVGPLAAIAVNTAKLPPILTRQEIAAQTLNARLAESREAAGRGVPEKADGFDGVTSKLKAIETAVTTSGWNSVAATAAIAGLREAIQLPADRQTPAIVSVRDAIQNLRDTVQDTGSTNTSEVRQALGLLRETAFTNVIAAIRDTGSTNTSEVREAFGLLRQAMTGSGDQVTAAIERGLASSRQTAEAVNNARSAIGRGFSELGGGVSALSGPLRNVASQTSQQTAAARTTAQQTSLVAARVAEARSAIGRGFSELGGVVRSSKNNLRVTVNVTSSIAISETLRRITSARVATGTISEF